MKKTVIIILAVLPIVLLITIAFAGRIFSIYRHVSVEKVTFIDELGEELDSEYVLTLNVGETKPTYAKVFPELATNKSVTYTISDEGVCTVDKDGNITGVEIGSAYLLVKTLEGAKTATLTVRVTAERVSGVSFPNATLELPINATKTMSAIVKPYTAINKNVTYTSDNPDVAKVSANGKITTHSVGTAVITATTEDGGFSATCTVIVKEGDPPIYFDFGEDEGISQSGVGYLVSLNLIDLSKYLKVVSSTITAEDVKLELTSDGGISTLEGRILTFSGPGVVKVIAYTGEDSNPENMVELLFLHY